VARTIVVVAPANTMADLPPALRDIGRQNLAALGFTVKFSSHVDARHFHLGGTPEQRLADLNEAFGDPAADVVMAAFGGYNSNQLLHRIDYAGMAAGGKTLVGFSDVTGLLLAVGPRAHVPVVHGPSFSTFCDPGLMSYTANGLQGVLGAGQVTYRSPCQTADDLWYRKEGYGPRELSRFEGWKVVRDGVVTAPVVGGNLETLCALAGTRYFPEVQNHLFFIEDAAGTNVGSFHRGLTQLAQMGVFERIAGLMVGLPPRQSQLADHQLMKMILEDVLADAPRYPVIIDVNCSHVDPMMSIPLFAPATLDASAEPTLTVAAVGGDAA
jgi:muramoyltetrapeptide carboxypeptidase